MLLEDIWKICEVYSVSGFLFWRVTLAATEERNFPPQNGPKRRHARPLAHSESPEVRVETPTPPFEVVAGNGVGQRVRVEGYIFFAKKTYPATIDHHER